jgi:hypothetical protein
MLLNKVIFLFIYFPLGMQVHDSPFKNLFSCIKSTYQQGGMKIFFISYPVTVLMNIPYASVHFMAYGFFFKSFKKKETTKKILHEKDEEEKSWKHFFGFYSFELNFK